jgi:DNA ligase-1
MKSFAKLLDRLSLEPRRNSKIALMRDYFAATSDPERGLALAAITGDLSFQNAKPSLVKALISERTDPVLFKLSRDYVGDMSETVALMWPSPENRQDDPPSLPEIVETLQTLSRAQFPAILAGWLDVMDEVERWALLKLITGALRIGVSARLAKTAVAEMGPLSVDDLEQVWHGVQPPYETLFAWAEGKGDKPDTFNPAPFHPVMLAHAIDADKDFDALDANDFMAEWKWDGIRVQASSGRDRDGVLVFRLFSRTGDDISGAFPDLTDALDFEGTIDGELLILKKGSVQSFNVLQQRLNRKSVTPKLLKEFPAHIRAYDLLALDGADLRERPFRERREELEKLVNDLKSDRIDLSLMVPFTTWEELTEARADPASHGAGNDSDAVEGVMIKRADSPYLTGRPKGYWWKWKRDPHTIDAVLMYAQRGSGKRSSFYSDYTFGVWREDENGTPELVPVGKAYFGFTDEELKQIDRFVRKHTVDRFGPVRAVEATPEKGLVLEIAFEGLARSSRHKSGVAMRFPRISRLRWDKPAREADRLETLEAML